jgi:hypothetical protein
VAHQLHDGLHAHQPAALTQSRPRSDATNVRPASPGYRSP